MFIRNLLITVVVMAPALILFGMILITAKRDDDTRGD